MANIKVKLVKSLIGCKADQIATAHSLIAFANLSADTSIIAIFNSSIVNSSLSFDKLIIPFGVELVQLRSDGSDLLRCVRSGTGSTEDHPSVGS